MTDKQVEHIRESTNRLQKILINQLYEKKQKLKKKGKIMTDSMIFLKN